MAMTQGNANSDEHRDTAASSARVDELEIKIAFQEQLISDLNDELVAHGHRIASLEKQLERLIEHLNALPEKAPTDHEPPPHY